MRMKTISYAGNIKSNHESFFLRCWFLYNIILYCVQHTNDNYFLINHQRRRRTNPLYCYVSIFRRDGSGFRKNCFVKTYRRRSIPSGRMLVVCTVDVQCFRLRLCARRERAQEKRREKKKVNSAQKRSGRDELFSIFFSRPYRRNN